MLPPSRLHLEDDDDMILEVGNSEGRDFVTTCFNFFIKFRFDGGISMLLARGHEDSGDQGHIKGGPPKCYVE